MKSYRVAIISYHTSPLAALGGGETGGLNVYVRELARELAERGHRVDVFTRRADTSSPQVEPIEPKGARLVHVDAGPARYIRKGALTAYVEPFRDGVSRFVAQEGLAYDVVHSHYWLSGLVGEQLKHAWGVPHVAMFHTLAEVKSRSRVSEVEPAQRVAAERMIVQQAERIIAAGRDERDLLMRLYGADSKRIAVVPCGVNLDVFQPIDQQEARRQLGLRSDDRILLFVGRIEPLKGVDILLGAAAQLESESDCFVLVIGGDSTTRKGEVEQLRHLAAELGIGEQVNFLGAVDHERLPLFYSAADVCVMPSFYESFGLVALESMACGTPVVASRVGGLTAAVRDGETGYLIPWRCPEPFAERIELLLGNEELRRAFGESGRKAVERFRWGNVAEATLGLYAEVIDGAPARASAAFRN
jgi:D-inositol-3-phosphate glycosyltransferase